MYHAELKVCPKATYVLACDQKEDLSPLNTEHYQKLIEDSVSKSDYRIVLGSFHCSEKQEERIYLRGVLSDGHRVEGLIYEARVIFQFSKEKLLKQGSNAIKTFLKAHDGAPLPLEGLRTLQDDFVSYLWKLGIPVISLSQPKAA